VDRWQKKKKFRQRKLGDNQISQKKVSAEGRQQVWGKRASGEKGQNAQCLESEEKPSPKYQSAEVKRVGFKV